MKKHATNIGEELLFLLRQQRYLYHQFKILTDFQQQLAETNSPELLLEVIFGRRKLTEKLCELDDKLRPIRANWRQLSSRIGPVYKAQIHKIVDQVQETIDNILAVATSETIQNLPLQQDRKFDELFAETKL